ncbi:hypothetical protein AV530_002933 [Patagioenas fasciata monilis]|uniref:Uncharacterized protein n=1 Tax=Patagioenas fasciata monilis TaxID=372326 RepID=A0A1V4K9N8_PATFA|nr:hypothetical protein AV530_002933 [Patagioenas fasciata monilis]
MYGVGRRYNERQQQQQVALVSYRSTFRNSPSGFLESYTLKSFTERIRQVPLWARLVMQEATPKQGPSCNLLFPLSPKVLISTCTTTSQWGSILARQPTEG